MRNVVYGVGISLDGYIARPDGAVDFLFMPDDFSMGEFMQSVDVAIMGRKTYDDSLKMGATYGPGMATFIYSRSLPPGARPDSTVVVSTPPDELLRGIREEPGKDIWLMGGGETARSFLEADMVDEIYLGVVPVLIGTGLPAFPGGFPERKFELTVCKSYSRGLVELRYRRVRG
jgi:dihydrofolate reductase